MALIRCPECGGNVSTQAPACPHCGAPTNPVAAERRVLTTQRTKKQLKGRIVLAALMTFAGGIWFIVSNGRGSLSPWAIVLFVVGVTWWITTRASIWWHHG